jgi:hypothetical protein
MTPKSVITAKTPEEWTYALEVHAEWLAHRDRVARAAKEYFDPDSLKSPEAREAALRAAVQGLVEVEQR